MPADERRSSTSGPRTILVGDVHGCLDELQLLLRDVAFDRATDRVILVGDLTAKGPDSPGVVALAREQGFRAVLGNHDAKVLSLRQGGALEATHGAEPGTHAHVAAALGASDWRYLAGLPLYLSLPELDTLVVHGGFVPGVPLTEQPRHLLLNMRSITPKGEPSKRVHDGVPWGSRWPGPAHVVFGHDAVRGLQQHPHATGLDTGCVYGRALTALILPERRLVSVPARRAYVDM
jgi:Calcineurin-like phosphoesterase